MGDAMFYQKDLVAVDMGSACIKVLSYKKKGNKYYMDQKPVVEQLPRGIIQQGRILSPDQLTPIFKRLYKRCSLFSKTKRCALSINSGAVIIRRVDVEKGSSEGDFGEQVKQVAEQIIDDFEHIHWGYSVVGEGSIPGHKAVAICGAKMEIVETYLSVIHSVGLKVGVMDSSVTCITNTFAHNYEKLPGLHMIVDIGSSSSNVVFLLNGAFCFTRTIILGGDAYTSGIAGDMGMEQDRAENLKIHLSSGSVSVEVSQVLQGIHESFAGEITTSLDYYNRGIGMKLGNNPLQSIFLAGGGSRIPGLAETIASRCGVTVSHLDPFRKIVTKLSRSAQKELSAMSAFYGVTSGLGVRHVGD